MDVNVTTIEAPKGKGTKGMVDYIQDGVAFHHFKKLCYSYCKAFQCRITFFDFSCIVAYNSKAMRCTSTRHPCKRSSLSENGADTVDHNDYRVPYSCARHVSKRQRYGQTISMARKQIF